MPDVWPWIGALPSAFLILAALIGPGCLLGAALGMRRWPLAMATPLLSVFLVGTGAVVASWTPLRWGWGPVAAWTLVLSALAWSIRFALHRVARSHLTPPLWGDEAGSSLAPGRGPLIALAVGVLLASVQSAWGMMAGIGAPGRPPQTWDSVFHLSAVRWVLDTGDGSTLDLGAMTNATGTPAFYPAGWHDLVTLGCTGDVVTATTMTALVVACVLWPFAAGVLTLHVLPGSTGAAFVAPLFAASFTAFPERVASFGTLWPMLLATSLVPLALALFLRVRGGPQFRPVGPDVIALMTGLCGIAIVHPSGVFTVGLLGIWPFLGLLVALARGRVHAPRAWKAVAVAVPILLVTGLAVLSRTSLWAAVTGYGDRVAQGTLTQKFWGALFDIEVIDQYGTAGAQGAIGVLVLVGIVVSLRMRGRRWLPPAWLAALYLYLVAATLALPGLAVVGPWYSDPVRLGAIIPLIATPLATIPVAMVCDRLIAWVVARGKQPVIAATIVACLALVVFFPLTSGYGRARGAHQMDYHYRQDNVPGHSSLVSDDEVALFHRSKQELPAGARVIGSPMDGASLLYAVGDVDVAYRSIYADAPPDLNWAAEHFGDLMTDPQVCRALADNSIEFFYSDSVTYLPEAGVHQFFAQLEEPGELTEHFELVDRGGTAALWKLTPCDPAR